MATSIFLPQWGMGMQEATIIKWLKKEGDLVKKGEPLVEVESSKVNAEVESSVDGYLIKMRILSNLKNVYKQHTKSTYSKICERNQCEKKNMILVSKDF